MTETALLEFHFTETRESCEEQGNRWWRKTVEVFAKTVVLVYIERHQAIKDSFTEISS